MARSCWSNTRTVKKIIVGLDTPIVRYEVGSVADVKVGAAFSVVAATKQADNTFTTARISVGRDGGGPIDGRIDLEIGGVSSRRVSYRPDKGESFDDLVARAKLFMETIASESSDYALVIHGNFIRAVLALILDLQGASPAKFNIAHCGSR